MTKEKAPFMYVMHVFGTVVVGCHILKWQIRIQLGLSHIQKLSDAAAADCIEHVVAIKINYSLWAISPFGAMFKLYPLIKLLFKDRLKPDSNSSAVDMLYEERV